MLEHHELVAEANAQAAAAPGLGTMTRATNSNDQTATAGTADGPDNRQANGSGDYQCSFPIANRPPSDHGVKRCVIRWR